MPQTYVIRNERDMMNALRKVRAWWARAESVGKHLDVKIGEHKPPRTLSQNATLHMWFGEMADQTGAEPEDIKRELKHRFLPKVERRILGKVRIVPVGTSDLSKAQMIEFMERVQQLAAEYEIALTHPEAQEDLG